MLDNWDFTKSDGRPNIMEGPHGSNRPWREYYGEMSPKDKRGFWLAMLGVGAFLAGLIALAWVMIRLGP